ncbi:MAG: hypothetical protein WA888_12710 [Burkholderiaceae bacterium]
MINRTEVELLKPTLIGALVLTLVGCAAFGYAWWRFDTAREVRENDGRNLLTEMARVDRMRETLRQATLFSPRFEALEASGVVGDFPKARTLDRFESSLRAQGISVHGFSLGVEQPTDPLNAHDFRQFSPGRFELTFSADVLHERQFGQMAAAVKNALSGLSTMEACSLTRDTSNSSLTVQSANSSPGLRARCTVNWYVFSPVKVDTMAGAAPPPVAN